MSVTSNKRMVTDGLIACWDVGNDLSYPGSGTSLDDVVGPHDGTLINGLTYSSGNGGYLTFDGVSDHVQCGSNSALDFSENDAFTVQLWFRSDRNNEFQILLSRREAAPPYEGWELTMGPSADRQELYAVFNSNVNFSRKEARSTTFNYLANTWRNVAFSYDGSASSSGWSFYGEGTDVGFTSLTNSSFGTSVSTTENTDIGGRSSGSLHGEVACVTIYDRELTAAEITQNYNALKNRFV